MNRKRSGKYVLTTGKKSRSYYEGRTAANDQDADVDFNLPHFNVDFDDVLLGPFGGSKRKLTKENKSVQTGFERCVKSTQTLQFAISSGCQTSPLKAKDENPSVKTAGTVLLEKIMKHNVWESFAKEVKKCGQTESVVKLFCSIGTGKLKTSNLSWKCALDMGKMSLLKTTTNMTYDPECVEFFSLFALMFGCSAVNVLRGPGNFSQVITEKTKKGIYDPQEGHFNFAIPSISTLKKVSSTYPKNIPVGLVEHSLSIAAEQARERNAQFVLGFDGKLVAAGCKGESDGDINLWGRETPSLQKVVSQLERNTKLCDKIQKNVTSENIVQHSTDIVELTYCVSERLKALRNQIISLFYMKKKLVQSCKENPDNESKYMRRISIMHQNSADCEVVLKMGSSTQSTMATLLSNENGTQNYIPTQNLIYLSNCCNVFQLLPPEIVPDSINLEDEQNKRYIKQGSTLWHAQRKLARITASTMHRALGLDTLANQKAHHAEFVLGRTKQPFTADVQKRLDHGLKNEKNVIATLVSTILPAFFPPCFCYFETGPMFIHTRQRRNFIEVSPDGMIKCTLGPECPYRHQCNHKTMGIEVKSPFPDNNIPDYMFYQIPPRYVLQVEAQMVVLESEELLLLCGGKNTVIAMRQRFDRNLWETALNAAIDMYGDEKPKVPTRLHPITRSLRELVSNFSSSNSSLLCEVPALAGEYGTLTVDPDVPSPYAVKPYQEKAEVDYVEANKLTKVVHTECLTFFNQAHTALRT